MRKILRHSLSLVIIALGIGAAQAQTSSSLPDHRNGSPTDSRKPVTTEAEVERALHDFYDAVSRGDEATALRFIADDGFSYDASRGYSSGGEAKADIKTMLRFTKGKVSYDLSDLKAISVGPDTVMVNYRLLTKQIQDAREQSRLFGVTDLLVRRAGRWEILGEHHSLLPKPVEPLVPGLPAGWRRTPGGTADRYSISVDTTVRHGGKGSASIKFDCGNEQAWASLGQPIAADEYRAMRVRLSGWLKTSDVDGSGLWMRVDGDRRILGFDNMDNRAVRGTTDWTMYSVVLDVPENAKNIFFGILLVGKGQVWADDLSLEVVDQDVVTTNLDSPEDLGVDNPDVARRPKETNKRPVNLGFEEGVIR